MANFTRMMLKVPEHTWGVDTKKGLDDYSTWDAPALRAALAAGANANFSRTVYSWERQRAYLDWALEALPTGHPLGALARRELRALQVGHSPRYVDPSAQSIGAK